MSNRENIRLIARAPFIRTPLNFSEILSLISRVFINIYEYGH